ncbi:MAG: hypothetical protein J1F10_05775 [Muribaculaceae bacterium]|nr:hypothetical protein [Muribaculaceae bacterium]
MNKIKQSVLIPLLLTIYLIIMVSIFGMRYYHAGEYLFFFGITVATLVIIIALHFLLKRKERLRREREEDIENNSKQ